MAGSRCHVQGERKAEIGLELLLRLHVSSSCPYDEQLRQQRRTVVDRAGMSIKIGESNQHVDATIWS